MAFPVTVSGSASACSARGHSAAWTKTGEGVQYGPSGRGRSQLASSMASPGAAGRRQCRHG